MLDRGVRFTLDDDTFMRWWNTAIAVEDGEEFVHFQQGNSLGARFVCALDYLKTVHHKEIAGDLLVTAYAIAKDIPDEAAREHAVRVSAQALFQDPSVQALLDRVRYRAERAARERIAKRMARRIEKLFDATESTGVEDQEGVASHRLTIDAAAKFLTMSAREKASDDERRDRRALQSAIERGRQTASEQSRIPTPEEAVRSLLMLKNELGAEAFAKIIAAVEAPKLG